MDFTYVIEDLRQEDCIMRVLYKKDGLKDRRFNVKFPANVLKNQDQAEIREWIIRRAPIHEWQNELDIKDEVPSQELLDLIGADRPVTSTEYDDVTTSPQEILDPIEVV